MSRATVGLTISVLVAVAPTTAAPVPDHLRPKGPSPYYHATSVGAKWVYTDGTKGVFGEIEDVFSVSAVEKSGTEFVVTVVKHHSDGHTAPVSKVLVTPWCVKQIEDEKGKLASPRYWLQFPRLDGETREVDCSTESYIDLRQDTVLGSEVVEVPAGKFNAIRVRSELNFGPRRDRFGVLSCSIETWYAPGIGVVKIEHRGHQPWVLKSFTP